MTPYDKNNMKVVVHFAKDRPRPDVGVMVISIMSTNAIPVKNFVFQAAVPKVHTHTALLTEYREEVFTFIVSLFISM